MAGHPVEIRGDRYIQRVDAPEGSSSEDIMYLRGTIRGGGLHLEVRYEPAPYEEARNWLDQLHR